LELNIIFFKLDDMTAVQAFDYTKGLQECLTKHLKIFENDFHPSHNPVYNAIIRRKIKFIKWILKAIETYPGIEFQVLVTMIDSEIIIYKEKLNHARTRPATDKAFDAIQHLEWLRNVLTSTHRSGFNGTVFF
jgi:hypothetical protein